jgi:redox-sensitive bicupin YhaK (pirin superfamily)
MLVSHPSSTRDHHGKGPFRIERIRPGRGINADQDEGLGPLGAFDHAYLKPGMVVGMHEHRNDEIITYVRKGAMLHIDTLGNKVPLTPTQFSVMSAGRGMQHEEQAPVDGSDVELLQIFVRPHSDNLEPLFQTHRFDVTSSLNAWRWIFGPEGSGAPLVVRNQVWMHDIALDGSAAIPSEDGRTAWVYVVDGSVECDGQVFNKGDGFSLNAAIPSHPNCIGRADLVCFQIEESASVTRNGTLSA